MVYGEGGVDVQVVIGVMVSLSLARRFEALLWWSGGYLFVCPASRPYFLVFLILASVRLVPASPDLFGPSW